MPIEFRVKDILEAARLLDHGIYARIAAEAGIDRKTLGDIIKGRCRTIRLATLERLCNWLCMQGVEGLPGALLGFRPSNLMCALAEPGLVTIYEAERQDGETAKTRAYMHRRWDTRPRLSRDDAVVAAIVVELLSALGGVRLAHEYVPGDLAAAKAIFRRIRGPQAKGSAVYIGSPLAHGLTSFVLGEIFKCEPLVPAPDKVPVYMRFTDEAGVRSCLGGTEPPPGYEGNGGPGIYYKAWCPKAKEHVWVACPSVRGQRDAGVVIVRRDAGVGRTEMAVFGYSGPATAALGDLIRNKPDEFWDFSDRPRPGVEVRIYVCTFKMTEASAGRGAVHVRNEQIVMLHSNLLPAA